MYIIHFSTNKVCYNIFVVIQIKMMRINVGGTIFCTCKDTLEKMDYFKASLSEKWLTTDEPQFIDRDPNSFSKLLHCVRGYSFDPEQYTRTELINLKEDADYFGAEELKHCVDQYLKKEDQCYYKDVTKWIKMQVDCPLVVKCKERNIFQDYESSRYRRELDSVVTFHIGKEKMKIFRSHLFKWPAIYEVSFKAKSFHIDNISFALFINICDMISGKIDMRDIDFIERDRWNKIFMKYEIQF